MRAIISLSLVLALSGLAFAAGPAGGLHTDMIERIEADFNSKGNLTAVINAVTNNSIQDLSLNREKVVGHNDLFNVKLKKSGITNQAGSGRCWLFAGLNVFSPHVMSKLQLGKFEFSQPYLTFWDKMEKANYFLEEIMRLRDRELYDRELSAVLGGPFGDGGWWHYATDLIDKYGVVPLSAMPETKQSSSTGQVNKLASRKLRAFASELRSMYAGGATLDEMRVRKEEMLGDVYALLVYAYGKPPREFTFRYEAKDSSIVEPKTYTPMTFYDEFLGGTMPEYVVLMDNPAKDYDVLYRIESSRNMNHRDDLTLLNLPIETIKQYCLKSLIDSTAVWFACDVGEEHYRDSGLLAVGIYDYETFLGMPFALSKADRITYRDSYPNHAMVLLGADTAANGRPQKWLIENSWGQKKGDKGYWYMYDNWFDEYVYVAVIEKRLLTDRDRAKWEQDPVVLPTWDPFYKALKKLQ